MPKIDPTALIAQMMQKLKATAPGEGAGVVPRQPNTQAQSFGPDPSQKVMATPGETYIPPDTVKKPGILSLLERINSADESYPTDPTLRGLKHLDALYEKITKPFKAFTLAMSMFGAMTGGSDAASSVYTGEKNPLDAAISVAENVSKVRRSQGEDSVQESMYRGDSVVGKKEGGLIEPTTGTTGEDSESTTWLDPGGFVVNAKASGNPNNSELLNDLLLGDSPFLWMEKGGSLPGMEPPVDSDAHLDPDMGQATVDATHVDMDMSQATTKDGMDYSKIQGLINQAMQIKNGMGGMVGKMSPSQGMPGTWGSSPDLHQAVYGRSPSMGSGGQSGMSGGMGGMDMGDMKKVAGIAMMVAAPEMAIPEMALGGEGLMGGLMGEGAAGAEAGSSGGLFSDMGASFEKLFGMMGDKKGSPEGGGGMEELIKTMTDLINLLKGQQTNDRPVSNSTTGPMGNPNRRTQGIDWGSIMRTMGR